MGLERTYTALMLGPKVFREFSTLCVSWSAGSSQKMLELHVQGTWLLSGERREKACSLVEALRARGLCRNVAKVTLVPSHIDSDLGHGHWVHDQMGQKFERCLRPRDVPLSLLGAPFPLTADTWPGPLRTWARADSTKPDLRTRPHWQVQPQTNCAMNAATQVTHAKVREQLRAWSTESEKGKLPL